MNALRWLLTVVNLGLAGFALAAAAPAGPVEPVNPAAARLAALALAADAAAARAAVADLRLVGPDAVPALLAAQAEHPAAASRFRDTLDQVCAQRDCAASHLFWYTDLGRAKEEARRTGRPILSLRLLGRLDQEMSCANSRFFRTILYANPEVARSLREGFVLHWSSERPVPKVTIDFGDGRALKGTITGNSIHYVLDSRGRLVDALPGLYGPRAFQRLLEADRRQALELARLDDSLFGLFLQQFHLRERDRIDAALDRDLKSVGGARQVAEAERRQRPRSGATPTAYQAVPLAMTKSAGEIVPLQALSIAVRQQMVAGADWAKIARLHREDWLLDPHALAELERKQSTRTEDPAQAREAVREFQRLVGIDTVRDEYVFHAVLHAWFGRGGTGDLDSFNERVYADLFLTPRSDPWLGLASPETFMALEPQPGEQR